MKYIFRITPVAKPRMTQKDRWYKRSATEKYFQFKKDLLNLALINKFIPSYGMKIVFFLPIPISWPKKKRLVYDGKPHQQKPDLDNLIKAVNDSFFDDDSKIWDITASKFWVNHPEGRIEIENIV